LNDSLYIALFSTGHVKVGRSIDPQGRVAQHAERVACLGVELVDHRFFSCIGDVALRERQLIAYCAERCSARFKYEWFSGLSFEDVCAKAQSLAVTATAPPWPTKVLNAGMFNPPHPGLTLRDSVLPALGLSVTQAAEMLDVTRVTFSRVINGQAAISPEMAVRLEAWLGEDNGGAAYLWLGQQAAYDEWQARKVLGNKVRKIKSAKITKEPTAMIGEHAAAQE
jgi:addiction module HigA family antidote